jgi:penicillin-binding protein 2
LKKSDLRWFGIGQGNFRVTPLQVVNAMAAIARKGLYKQPRLIISQDNPPSESVSLDISPDTLSVIYDGMKAAITESGGTANKEFEPMLDYFKLCDVTIYGKTGSTQAPENAWFAGFAKDSNGRAISIAVVVEGGQHGSSDAAPLARDIIDFCIQAGYLGQPVEYPAGETE